MKITVPRLVLAGLLVAYLMGQGERLGHAHSGGLRAAAGIALDMLVVLLICAGVSLYWYLRHGHPVPGHHPRQRHAEPEPEPEVKRGAVAFEQHAEVVELHAGVRAGPAPPVLETDDAAVLPNRSIGGGEGIDTLEVEDVRQEAVTAGG